MLATTWRQENQIHFVCALLYRGGWSTDRRCSRRRDRPRLRGSLDQQADQGPKEGTRTILPTPVHLREQPLSRSSARGLRAAMCARDKGASIAGSGRSRRDAGVLDCASGHPWGTGQIATAQSRRFGKEGPGCLAVA